jgi:hypothetical protein
MEWIILAGPLRSWSVVGGCGAVPVDIAGARARGQRCEKEWKGELWRSAALMVLEEDRVVVLGARAGASPRVRDMECNAMQCNGEFWPARRAHGRSLKVEEWCPEPRPEPEARNVKELNGKLWPVRSAHGQRLRIDEHCREPEPGSGPWNAMKWNRREWNGMKRNETK